MDVTKIEERLDKSVAGATEIRMDLGGVKFQTMMELMEFAKLMSLSGLAVPVHLRGNPGACLAVCTKALRFGFDPFSLAERSYSMKKSAKGPDGKWEDVETIAYDSYVIRAIINAHAPIEGAIDYKFEGEGNDRVCIATAKRKDNGAIIVHKSAKLGEKLAAMARNDKGQIKGSPLWEGPKSDVQMAYDTGRDLCRMHFPEVLMGWYDKDEFDEQTARAAAAKDVTPKPNLAGRLKGTQGRGFDAKHVERETSQNTKDTSANAPLADVKAGEVLPAGDPAPADDTATVASPATPIMEVSDAMELGREMKAKGEPLTIPDVIMGDLFEPQREALKAGYEEHA
jgi:hypothetical protein